MTEDVASPLEMKTTEHKHESEAHAKLQSLKRWGHEGVDDKATVNHE